MADVIVIGAGIAGLAAAYELHRQGLSFVLVEARARPGGVIFSEEVDGYTIDAGPDALLVQKPEGLALCQELGLSDRLISTKPPRVAFVQRNGRLHALPASSVLGIPTRLGPFVRTNLFSWPGKLRMAMELFVRPGHDEDESIGAFITRRFGAEAATYLAEPLLAGIHAGDVDRLSVAALFPRFRELERTHGSLLRALRNQHRGSDGAQREEGGAFRSLPGGLVELVGALTAALPAGALCLNTGVKRVVRSPARAAATDRAGQRDTFLVETTTGALLEAAVVVLATPAFASGQVLRELDSELADVCGQIPYASTATVALAFDSSVVAHPLQGSGFVVPRVEGTGILAASWLSSKWPHRAPAGKVLLRTFAGGARDPRALDLSDEELIARSMNALTPLLGISGPPLLSRVFRWDRASAQHEVGHLTLLAAIDRLVSRHTGLYLTGSGFRGVGIPDCIADGRATARRVAAGFREIR